MTLPARMEMQVEFVDQDDAGGFQGRAIVQMRIELRAPHGDVGRERDHAPLSVAQEAEREAGAILELDDDIVLLQVELGGARVFHAGRDGLVNGVERRKRDAPLRLDEREARNPVAHVFDRWNADRSSFRYPA